MGATIRTLGLLSGLAFLLSGCIEGSTPAMAEWHGPPFSAEIVDLHEPNHPPAQIYLGDGKMRFDGTDSSHQVSLIFDPAHQSILVLMNKDHRYVDAGVFTPVVVHIVAPLIRFFRPASASDPCVEWNSTVMQYRINSSSRRKGDSAHSTHFSCRHLGSDMVAGRPAEKWAVTDDTPDVTYSYSDTAGPDIRRVGHDSTVVWIDNRLHIVSRSTSNNDRWEMRNIHEGPQPSSLFEVPAGYQPLTVTEVINRLTKKDSAARR